MLKLPKSLKDHPQHAAIEQRFAAATKSIWAGGKLQLPHWGFDAPLRRAIRAAVGTGHYVQGLEKITDALTREQKGLKAAAAKHAVPPSPRLSRLLLLAEDGSERFYHDVESLLAKHADRTQGCVIQADATALGQEIGAKGPVKALLINDKVALGLFLATLADA